MVVIILPMHLKIQPNRMVPWQPRDVCRRICLHLGTWTILSRVGFRLSDFFRTKDDEIGNH
jgi:hypothetical protein